jgi:hypothetical protein
MLAAENTWRKLDVKPERKWRWLAKIIKPLFS